MVDSLAIAREQMLDRDLRGRGIRDRATLDAMARVAREQFVPAALQHEAYADAALPLSEGQTISQPYMVALMTESLELTGRERVLEVGTGSGYQTAVLAEIAAEVVTIERIASLSRGAAAVLDELGYGNVRWEIGDGTLGWPERAPYDRILVTAGAPSVPPALLAQLADGGLLVMPVGDEEYQRLSIVRRHGDDFATVVTTACRFVPLIGEQGWADGQ